MYCEKSCSWALAATSHELPTPAHKAEAKALNTGMAGAGVNATAGDVNLQAGLLGPNIGRACVSVSLSVSLRVSLSEPLRFIKPNH